ncbi:hypothetical protein AH04_269 [Erwinia phage AH04]|uniref:Uncharacterized protein n=1 Tax=Erwinia phage AH04 TaxID=2869569 RepID=A0AAE8BUY4_9CAUD|nr:hypothetical protein PQC02_gp045 [Erwinia phage AH04]QZA70742.1 hypothetical protein AH04_269 [Erwinia phage AH04]
MSINLNTLRIATQVRELLLQGVTLKNTFKGMEETWLSLYDTDKRCLIVEQHATKVKFQLVSTYAIKLIRYINSIVGLDLVPLAQQDPETRTWKNDAVVLNIGGNKVKSHEHMFRAMLLNLFGISEDIIAIAFEPTAENIRTYVKKTYDIDLGDTEGLTSELTIEEAEEALQTYLADPTKAYRLY